MRAGLKPSLALSLLLVLCPLRAWASPEPIPIAATQPWIALLAAFIGGNNVAVLPLQEWNAEGSLVPSDRGRALKSLAKETNILALDTEEAQNLGLRSDAYPNLWCLYETFPVHVSNMDAVLTDPSVLPFVAQRTLTALSHWDPSSYPYYQRRLAEFQARLFGAVLSGQQVLRGVTVYNLGGASGALLQAAGCKIETPPPEQLAEWARGRTSGLREILNAKWAEGVVTVLDSVTPKNLLHFLKGNSGVFRFERPNVNQDYPAFLHDQYIALWQMVSARRKALGK